MQCKPLRIVHFKYSFKCRLHSTCDISISSWYQDFNQYLAFCSALIITFKEVIKVEKRRWSFHTRLWSSYVNMINLQFISTSSNLVLLCSSEIEAWHHSHQTIAMDCNALFGEMWNFTKYPCLASISYHSASILEKSISVSR